MRESPLNDDELIYAVADNGNKDDENDEIEGEVSPLTADLIREGLKLAKGIEQHFLTHDPDAGRALKFQRNLQFCISGYQELYKQLEKPKKQQLITDFLIRQPIAESINYVKNSDVLLSLEISSGESNLGSIGNKCHEFLSSSEE